MSFNTANDESFTSFAILKLEEAKQILMETDTINTNVLPGLRQEHGELETQIRDARNESEKFDLQLANLREQTQTLEKEIQEADETETSQYADQLPALREEKQQLETTIDNNKREAENLCAVLLELSKQHKEAIRQAETQNLGLQGLREETRALELEIQQAKKSFCEAADDRAPLDEEYQQVQCESEELRAKLLAMRDEKETLQAQIQAVQQQALVAASSTTQNGKPATSTQPSIHPDHPVASDHEGDTGDDTEDDDDDDTVASQNCFMTPPDSANDDTATPPSQNYFVTQADSVLPWSQETANVWPEQQEPNHTNITLDGTHTHDDKEEDESNTSHEDKDERNTAVAFGRNAGCEDEEMENSVEAIESQTDASSSLLVVSAKKRRIRRVYRSPKKWRRMIHTHRLQSFFFDC